MRNVKSALILLFFVIFAIVLIKAPEEFQVLAGIIALISIGLLVQVLPWLISSLAQNKRPSGADD